MIQNGNRINCLTKFQPHNALITGGAGFIGSNFVRYWLATDLKVRIINLDLLTYAGSLANLEALPDPDRHTFVQGDISDRPLVDRLLREHAIDTIVHFAAESHVDRSISGPARFVHTNVVGTLTLLEAARQYWLEDCRLAPRSCRFQHISTDEVYGTLGPNDSPFTEATPYCPNNPYSASKAGGDHLVRAYSETYGLPVITTNCPNNYGPYQFPEKLIPLMIHNALNCHQLPVYGDGGNVRDWIYVQDHCEALLAVLHCAKPADVFNIGASCEKRNIDVISEICDYLDQKVGRMKIGSRRSLIKFIQDRPGHDRRYAMDATKIRTELGWGPKVSFQLGIRKTIDWYLGNQRWLDKIVNGAYRQYYAEMYSTGLGGL